MITILTLERIFQYLFVPHSNDNESLTHRKLSSASENRMARMTWMKWYIFIDIICNHIPKIQRGCNCVGMLYTCMAWICISIPHNTGKQDLFIFRWHPGRTSCNEEVTCSWLPEAFVTASLVPYDDDVTMRPWSLPSVFMFRRRLLRVLVWRPMSGEVKIISQSDF